MDYDPTPLANPSLARPRVEASAPSPTPSASQRGRAQQRPRPVRVSTGGVASRSRAEVAAGSPAAPGAAASPTGKGKKKGKPFKYRPHLMDRKHLVSEVRARARSTLSSPSIYLLSSLVIRCRPPSLPRSPSSPSSRPDCVPRRAALWNSRTASCSRIRHAVRILHVVPYVLCVLFGGPGAGGLARVAPSASRALAVPTRVGAPRKTKPASRRPRGVTEGSCLRVRCVVSVAAPSPRVSVPSGPLCSPPHSKPSSTTSSAKT